VKKIQIRILVSDPGWGEEGAVLEVSPERADRWCGKGIAELVGASKAKETKEKEKEILSSSGKKKEKV
jgi:hypothetical protein